MIMAADSIKEHGSLLSATNSLLYPERELPPARKKRPLVFAIVITTVIFVLLGGLHFRWGGDRIASWPITLKPFDYSWTKHSELLSFDPETQKLWEKFTSSQWFNTGWQVAGKGPAIRALDMLHKIHCLVAIRAEFTSLSLNQTHQALFYTRQKRVERLHLGHCFDLIRQV